MLTVRIPKEIRTYKEKIAFNLNARQIIAAIITLAICIPLYFYGRNILSDDFLTWLIILIAIPLLSIGFLKVNGLPAERFFIVWLKYELLHPRKRKYSTVVAYREWENEADREHAPKSLRHVRREKKRRREASLERAVLISEAQERGDYRFDVENALLITVGDTAVSGVRKKAGATTTKGRA